MIRKKNIWLVLLITFGCAGSALEIYERTDRSNPPVRTISTSMIIIKDAGLLGSDFLVTSLKYIYSDVDEYFEIRFIYGGKDWANIMDVTFSIDGYSETFMPISPTEKRSAKSEFKFEEDMTVKVPEELFKEIQSAKAVSIQIGSPTKIDKELSQDTIGKINSFYTTVIQKRENYK